LPSRPLFNQKEVEMNLHLVLPVAALAVLAALPASAQSYDPQGGGGAGPYDLRCQQIRNFNQREACTARLQRRYRASAECLR